MNRPIPIRGACAERSNPEGARPPFPCPVESSGGRRPRPRTIEAEVIVIGGGPAGSTVAAELARRDRDVLLVDRATFPRPKPCGECMNPGAVAILDRLGLLGPVMRTEPVPLFGWSLVTPRGRAAWAGFPSDRPALGVDRATLDRALLDEATRRGVRVLEGIRVSRVEPGGDGAPAAAWATESGSGPLHLVGSVIIGADGLRSVVSREIGAIRRPPRLRKASLTWRVEGEGPSRDRGRLLLGGDLTVGLAPVPGAGARLWNATLVVASQRLRERVRAEGWRLLEGGMERLIDGWTHGPHPVAGPWASGPFDWPVRRAVVGKTLLVGDAAGYFDPLTGQGIFRALRGAELAAGIVDAALPRRSGASRSAVGRAPVELRHLERYHRRLTAALAPGRGVQWVIDGVLARAALREPSIALLGRWPAAGSVLARITGDLIRET